MPSPIERSILWRFGMVVSQSLADLFALFHTLSRSFIYSLFIHSHSLSRVAAPKPIKQRDLMMRWLNIKTKHFETSPHTAKAGFTLMELMITVLIAGTLIATATLNINNLVSGLCLLLVSGSAGAFTEPDTSRIWWIIRRHPFLCPKPYKINIEACGVQIPVAI